VKVALFLPDRQINFNINRLCVLPKVKALLKSARYSQSTGEIASCFFARQAARRQVNPRTSVTRRFTALALRAAHKNSVSFYVVAQYKCYFLLC
jgi:hypothetical protein